MTAISGRRMAETVARRGGLAVLPQDIPVDVVARGRVAGSSRGTRSTTPRSRSTPHVDRRRGAGAARPSARTASSSSSTDGAPVGVVTEGDCQGVDRFTQLAQVMTPRPADHPGRHRPAEDLRRARPTRASPAAPVVEGDGGWSASSPARARCARRSTRPAVDADGDLLRRAAVGINGDVAGKAARPARGRRRRARRRHRARPPGRRRSRRCARCASVAGSAPGRRRQRRLGRGHPRADRGRRRHRQGRRRPRRDVHDADDDRRRPAAVLRGRWSAPTAARELGKHVWADGGVRHPRDVALALAAGASNVMIGSWFAGTYESPGDLHDDATAGSYKESLRHGVGAGGQGADGDRVGLRAGPQGAVRGGHLVVADVPRPGAARRRGPDRRDRRRASARRAPTPARARSSELHERAVLGVQSAAGYEEGRPLPTSPGEAAPARSSSRNWSPTPSTRCRPS